MKLTKNTKIGLALGSGGIRGFAHLGVIKAIEEAGLEISYIAGASAGAIVGAFYAAGKSPDWIFETLVENKTKLLAAMVDLNLRGGFIKGQKISDLLKEWLPVKKFSELQIPCGIVATDLKSGTPVYFTKGEIIPAVRASISVPTVFKPVKLKEKILADGGLCVPVPDAMVREMGAQYVISINLDNHNTCTDPEANYKSLKDINYRSINILRHYLAKYSLKDSDLIIEPNIKVKSIVGLEQFFTTDETRLPALVDEGYQITKAALKKVM